MPDNGKAQTQSAVATGGGGVRLAKSLKHVRQKFRSDAFTGIDHGDLRDAVYSLQDYDDLPAFRSELDGVGEQVPQTLLNSARIASHRPCLGVENGLQPNLLGAGRMLHGSDS